MTPTRATRVLLTGATGVLGAELLERLAGSGGTELVATSRRGAADRGVLALRLGHDPVPAELRRGFDVIVHSAALTKWNVAPEQALAANVRGTEAVLELAGPDTHFVHLSTAYATGLRGDASSDRLCDYRNTYEWSKAASERVAAEHPRCTIIRPPLIIGRRSDGHVARFSGLYTLLRACLTGLAPVVVADPAGTVDLTPVDDVADVVLDAVAGDPRPAPVVIGCGRHAVTTGQLTDILWGTLNSWRAGRGIPRFVEPPAVTTERWERFFLPFARTAFSAAQLRVIQLLSEFVPYLSTRQSTPPDVLVAPIRAALARTVRYWADCNPRLAAGQPRPWQAEGEPALALAPSG